MARVGVVDVHEGPSPHEPSAHGTRLPREGIRGSAPAPAPRRYPFSVPSNSLPGNVVGVVLDKPEREGS
jgi:hypothetical protein